MKGTGRIGAARVRERRPSRETDLLLMRLALGIARRGRSRVQPNPLVGAVVVQGDEVVGEGHHEFFGGPHAEVNALRAAGQRARGGTLYVTLEPCAHAGKTPPCTETIRQAGVQRVVCAMEDPHPRVRGRGVRALRRSGIAVEVGVLEGEAHLVNEAYLTYILEGRPFVSLKLASTLDGRLTPLSGARRWITGPLARRAVQELRRDHGAVLVGVGTVLRDDPRLGLRGESSGMAPLRVVLDTRLRTPPDARVLSPRMGGQTLLVAGRGASRARRERLVAAGGEVLEVPRGRKGVSLAATLRALARRGISSVLVEGGPRVATAFLRERLVDKVYLFVAPLLLGERAGLAAFGDVGARGLADAIRLRGVTRSGYGEDTLVVGYPSWPARV